ncbi:MAG: cadmium-translocating P-type ATPase [Candidatus Thorarchaeota archaeon]|nr:cadmium-translocating P-type ATPase [Candidatus Thorarchaeota archaeon]
MSQESETTCATCAASSGSESEKPKRYKYRMAGLSASALVGGIILDLTGFDILVVYGVFLVSMLSAGQFIMPRGARGLRKFRLDIHFLMSSASIGAFIIGAPAEGAAVMFLFFISMLLEERAEDQVKKELRELVELEPPSATIKMNKGAEALIPTSEVRRGDTLVIRPGSRIGLDGLVVCGATSVNQAPITGESLPVSKTIGDQVYAGTINQEGYIEVEVTSESNETVLSRIVKLVEEAKNKKAPTEQLISRFSRRYTPIMVTLTILLGLGSLYLGATITEATYRALTLLVISCPCAFVVSIPVSIVSSIAGSARDGVLVKGGIHIEQVSKTKVVAFDKTGTLTLGALSVKEVCLHNNYSRAEVLTVAATLEQMSEHPIARALVAVTEIEEYKLGETKGFSAIPGRGVDGQIGDTKYFVGNRRLLAEQQIELDTVTEHSCGFGTMVYVAQEQEHLGTIILSDSLRSGAVEAVRELREMGIDTIMLTGDSETVAKEIAEEVGIDRYLAELLPEEKVRAIEELSEQGSSIMIGDGINDAPALAAADIGIAMGAVSSDAALETSDIALMQQDLRKVPSLIKKARKTMSIVRQNIVVSISVKLLVGVLATFGLVNLWVAIGIGDMGLTFAVIANALRLVRKEQ